MENNHDIKQFKQERIGNIRNNRENSILCDFFFLTAFLLIK